MTYSQMLRLFEEAGLSPEKAAEVLGISGMSLRRWKSKPGHKEVPKIYANACIAGVRQLIAEGRIAPDSGVARQILKESGAAAGAQVERALGLPKDFLEKAAGNSDVLSSGLSRIGADAEHQKAVDEQQEKISSFAKWGKAWKRCITGLTCVIRSPRLTLMDKLVAYGALFYLLTPFDLIPDAIPGVGYLDDFAILSLALMYYERRYRRLFKEGKGA